MVLENCFIIEQKDIGQRLDVFLAGDKSGLSRSHVQKILEDGWVLVNETKVRASYRLKNGDMVRLSIPPPVEMKALPENIPLDIYYEDEDILVVNKPRGMVVHPAEGNFQGTLVNALLHHCKDLSGINGVLRPGIVHRLDKDTSGLLMVAKNDVAHLSLAEQLSQRQVVRRYLALVHGRVQNLQGRIDAPLGRDPHNRQKMAVVFEHGKQAVTHYQVKACYTQYTYVTLRLETGRTHQIRVHMRYIGHPVVGDPKYGFTQHDDELEGQFLHAAILGFRHPRTGESLSFEAPLPNILQKFLEQLENMLVK